MSEAWRTDPSAAEAEALRRIEAAAESDNAETRLVLDFSDLPALTRVPEEIGLLTDLLVLTIGHLNSEERSNVIAHKMADISALAALTQIEILSLSTTEVRDFSVLSSLSKLSHLIMFGTPVIDITPLSSLSALEELDLADTQVSDISGLSGLSALRRLRLSDTQVSDISGLSGLSALTHLDLTRTHVDDISALSGLSALTYLSLYETRVRELSVLLSIPVFWDERASLLSFEGTPAADPNNDRRLDLLSRLPGDRCAIETVQYLKGTHPDFRDPPAGGGAGPDARSVTDRLRDAAEVEVGVRDGKLVAGNASPPKRLAPVERDTRLDALRADVKDLLAEAEQVQLPHVQRSRLQRYAYVLAAEAPTYITLDGPMAILRGALSDRYVTDALDKGFVAGWTHLVATHDELRPPAARGGRRPAPARPRSDPRGRRGRD
ncbi:leucine-rich repeat domain-containing protein [Jannaschia pohangensis]|uniref:Leucine Rich repeat-containing protein n=1 Tax=Jannaschia pohangensis TaxID=390807 RepID=A0A1I3M5T7_9RHOB|nr:leucine-rich repeat domain-containing protein [Jannaschia pohangensis]SFI92332.1 Leucine Rich repeat-containing protein [Jannaschia pohangensis]